MKLERLREWRQYRGLTQEELAKLAGVPQSTVSQAETGKRSPHRGTAKKLAEALGVELEDLVRTPKVQASQHAREWLEEVVGHSYLTWNDQDAKEYQKRLTTVEAVEELRSQLRDEYDVIREALDSQQLNPRLREELQKAKSTLVQWHLELTKLVKRLRPKRSGTLSDEEL